MVGYQIPENEMERLAKVCDYKIIDPSQDDTFKRIVQLAAIHFGVPVAFISLIEEERQWFRAKIGIEKEGISPSNSYCARAICQDDVYIVEDAFKDEDYSQNRRVIGDTRVRFYAGAPIRTTENLNVGTIAIVDSKPRTLTDEEARFLKCLAGMVVDAFEVRLLLNQAKRSEQLLIDAMESLPNGFVLYDKDDRLVICNQQYLELYAKSADLIVPGASFSEIIRKGVERGQYEDAVGREEEWIAERLHDHNNPGEPIIQKLPGDKWLRIQERKTSEGGFVGFRIDISQLKQQEQKLARLAWTDSMTGVLNRRAFEKELNLRTSQLRPGVHFYVLQFDLDGFKEVNDTLGHPIGDMVLKRVAEIIKSKCRQSDVVARIGGDEFIVLLESEAKAGSKRIHRLADEIISRISDHMFIDDNEILIGASAGYAVAKELPINPHVLVANADIALYASKRTGKGIATQFTDDMREQLEKRTSIMAEVKRALDEDEFIPFFQPQVSFHDGQVVGFEVLGRWNHPERGILAPLEFIPYAEEMGLIDKIDQKIILAALDDLAWLRADGWNIPKISINVSSRSLRLPNFCSDLVKCLSDRNLLPEDIVVEVLETVLIENSGDQAVRTVRELFNAGFGVAIDDFGTGHASFAMVATLDITELKIDRSLVEGMENPKGQKVIEAIVALSKEMNLNIVTEGIETSAQYSALKELGCDVAQGYKLGHPMSRELTCSWFSSYGKLAAVNTG